MDICVLYGSSNKPLVSQLIGQLFTLQPKYADDISNAAALMVDNLQQLTASCVKLAQQVLQGQAKLVLELAGAWGAMSVDVVCGTQFHICMPWLTLIC